MQTPTTPLPPPPPPPHRPPLRRTSEGRVIGGVAGGLARWLDVDVVLVRVALVVLAVFGGSGLVAYLLAWLFVPSDDAEHSPAARAVGNNRFALWLCGIVIALIAFGLVSDAWVGKALLPGGMPMLVVVGCVVLAYLYLRRRDDRRYDERGYDAPATAWAPPPATDAPRPVPQPSPSSPDPNQTVVLPDTSSPWASTTLPLPTGAPDETAAGVPAPPASGGRRRRAPKPPKPPRPPRERSLLGRLTWSVLLLVVGVLLAMRFDGVVAVSAVVVLGAALLVVGVGLVVGAWWGRSRGLIWLGVLLVLALVPVGFVDNLGSSLRPSGSFTYTPSTTQALQTSYSSGSGLLRLDLTGLAPDSRTHDVSLHLTTGTIEIDVPPRLAVQVRGTARFGVVSLPAGYGQDEFGSPVTRTWKQHPRSGSDGLIRIDARVELGSVEIRVMGPGTYPPARSRGSTDSTPSNRNRAHNASPTNQGANA